MAAGASRRSGVMSPGVMWRWRTHGCSAEVLPGVETQRRSGGCSANVPRRDVAAAHTWLQCQAFCQALRCGTAVAAAPMSPGVTWRQRTHGCSAGFCQAPRHSGAAAVAVPMSPGVRWWRRVHGCSAGHFTGRRSAAALRGSSSLGAKGAWCGGLLVTLGFALISLSHMHKISQLSQKKLGENFSIKSFPFRLVRKC
jgi:hypothetical protein